MKNIENLYFTVSIILSFAHNFEQLHFSHQMFKIDTWNMYSILFSVEQMTFFCWAVKIPKKSVEQSRFEQMDFEQLTLTHRFHSSTCWSLLLVTWGLTIYQKTFLKWQKLHKLKYQSSKVLCFSQRAVSLILYSHSISTILLCLFFFLKNWSKGTRSYTQTQFYESSEILYKFYVLFCCWNICFCYKVLKLAENFINFQVQFKIILI